MSAYFSDKYSGPPFELFGLPHLGALAAMLLLILISGALQGGG